MPPEVFDGIEPDEVVAPAASHEERGVAPFLQRAQVQRRCLRRRAIRCAVTAGPATGHATAAIGGLGARKDHPQRQHAHAIQQPDQSGKPMARTAKGREVVRRDLVVARIAQPIMMGLLRRPKTAELADVAYALKELSTRTLIAGSVDDPACDLRREGRQPAEESRHDASSIERDGKPPTPGRCVLKPAVRGGESRRGARRGRKGRPLVMSASVGWPQKSRSCLPIERCAPDGRRHPTPQQAAARGTLISWNFCGRLRAGMATTASQPALAVLRRRRSQPPASPPHYPITYQAEIWRISGGADHPSDARLVAGRGGPRRISAVRGRASRAPRRSGARSPAPLDGAPQSVPVALLVPEDVLARDDAERHQDEREQGR